MKLHTNTFLSLVSGTSLLAITMVANAAPAPKSPEKMVANAPTKTAATHKSAKATTKMVSHKKTVHAAKVTSKMPTKLGTKAPVKG
jgi:hypothetical protein